MEDLKYYPGEPKEYTFKELIERVNDVENTSVLFDPVTKQITDPSAQEAVRGVVDQPTIRRLLPYANSVPAVNDEGWLDGLVSWVNGSGASYAGGFTVQWIDVDNGSDSYNGLRRDRAKKTFPQYPAAGTLYMVKSANPIALTNRVDFTNAGAAIASWDHKINGKLKIVGDLNTGDNTRTIRFSAADCSLINVHVTPPVGNGAGNRACINLSSGASGARVVGCVLEQPSSGNFGFAADINAPYFIFEDNEILGGHAGISVATTTAQLGAEARKSRIRRNKISLAPQIAAYSYDSDGITVGGICDWGHKLVISENEITGYWENAIDTTNGARVVVMFNRIGAPSLVSHGQPVYPSALILGNTSNTGVNNICLGNRITGAGAGVLQTTGINTRGGVRTLIVGNIIDGWDKGVVQGNTGSSGMVLVHNTIVRTSTGVRVENSNTGARVFNNIIDAAVACFDTGSGGADMLTGGNLCVGPMDNYELNTSKVAADLRYASLDELIDLVTYAPTGEARKAALVALNFTARDAFGAQFAVQCAGAVA